MINKIQLWGTRLERIADKILLLVAFVMMSGLSYYSIRYTEILAPGEVPVTIKDNTWLNLVMLAGIIMLLGLLRTLILPKLKKYAEKTGPVVTFIATVFVTCISILWVSICHVTPRADGSSVCRVAKMLMEGSDYGFMNPPAYMSFNPHLFNLLAVIQILFGTFGIGNYQAFQYMNALCIPLLFYSGYKILMLIYAKWEPVLYYIALFISCLPLFLYVPFVYGEITSITFTMVFMWQLICYCKTGRKSCFIWGTLSIAFACIMRMNSIVVLIAAAIVLIIYTLRTTKWQALLWMLAMIIAVFAANSGIRTYYETVSGNSVSAGIPYISYIEMGLEDSDSGPGWFNNTNYDQLIRHDYDTNLTAVDSTIAVKNRMKVFWNDKPYGIDFFRRKILSQWNAPAYNSLFETCKFDCEKDALPEIVRRIYYDNEPQISTFMNVYQLILFVCTTLMMIFALLNKPQTSSLEHRILIIAIVGGFLFSALWEAKSRYVLPYIIYMIPLAAVGMWQLQQNFAAKVKQLRRQ